MDQLGIHHWQGQKRLFTIKPCKKGLRVSVQSLESQRFILAACSAVTFSSAKQVWSTCSVAELCDYDVKCQPGGAVSCGNTMGPGRTIWVIIMKRASSDARTCTTQTTEVDRILTSGFLWEVQGGGAVNQISILTSSRGYLTTVDFSRMSKNEFICPTSFLVYKS